MLLKKFMLNLDYLRLQADLNGQLFYWVVVPVVNCADGPGILKKIIVDFVNYLYLDKNFPCRNN